MRKNKNILKKGMILAAVSTMVVTMAPAIPAYAYGEADSKTGQAAFNAATTGSADYQSWLTGTWQGGDTGLCQYQSDCTYTGLYSK